MTEDLLCFLCVFPVALGSSFGLIAYCWFHIVCFDVQGLDLLVMVMVKP
jgi:hypothetical protein